MTIRNLVRDIVVWITYIILTTIVTRPLFQSLGSRVPGSEGDVWVHIWTFRWVRDTLATAGDLYYTPLLFYPHGVSLVNHNIAWFHVAIWIPLQSVMGEAAAYTIVYAMAFPFTAITTYYLAKTLLKSPTAAFIAGIVAGFWPYNLSHHNHPNLIFIGFIPLVLLSTYYLRHRGRRIDVFFLGLAIAMVGIVRWQLLVFGSLLIVAYWTYALFQPTNDQEMESPALGFVLNRRLRFVLQTTVSLLIALILMLPLILPRIIDVFRGDIQASDLLVDDIIIGSTDLAAYFVPNRYHPLWGDFVFPLTDPFFINKVFTPFIGYTTLILILLGVFTFRHRVLIWLSIGVGYMILALGPELNVNGPIGLPMPYSLIANPWLDAIIRRTDRLNVILAIPMALLAAYGFSALIKNANLRWQTASHTRPHGRLASLLTVVAGLILFEYAVSFPTYTLETPQWYETIAQQDESFGILDLPMNNRTFDEQYMFYQDVHQKPIVGGHVSRPPAEAFSFIQQVPFLANYTIDNEPIWEQVNIGYQLELLANANVKYLVLHKMYLSMDTENNWRKWLTIDPIYEDEQLIVYRTDIQEGRDYIIEYPLIQDNEGDTILGLAHADIAPDAISPDSWLMIDLVWGSLATDWGSYDVCFGLRNRAGIVVQQRCEPVSKAWGTQNWGVNAQVRTSYQYNVSPYLDTGRYDFIVSLQDAGEPKGQAVTLQRFDLTTVERDFTRPQPQVSTNTAWDNQISLLGYDIQNEGTELTYYWTTTQRQETSYVIYTHLVEAETGEILWQNDAAPRNWSYPTNWWKAAEMVSDTIILPEAYLRDGVIVRVGMYDAVTQERVSVQERNGQRPIDQTITLFEIEK